MSTQTILYGQYIAPLAVRFIATDSCAPQDITKPRDKTSLLAVRHIYCLALPCLIYLSSYRTYGDTDIHTQDHCHDLTHRCQYPYRRTLPTFTDKMLHRVAVAVLTMFCPPLAVIVLTGVGSPETILNVILYLMAIVPAYIHGFYVYWRHFHENEIRDRHQWEGVQRQSTRPRRHSNNNSGGSSRSPSSRSQHSGKRVWYGEVEEYSSDDHRHHQRSRSQGRYPETRYIHPAHQQYIAVPPPAPDPPTQVQGTRYLH